MKTRDGRRDALRRAGARDLCDTDRSERTPMADPGPPIRTRRELLKLTPVLLAGAFAVPSWREPLLERGVAFSDWITGATFRSHHLAPEFRDADVVPFERFPYNYFDELEPEIDFDAWKLEVSGAVSRPGDYTLAQIKALPKIVQNTKHVCVEGWDVIGRFGGARISDFLQLVGADPQAGFLTVTCADNYFETLDMPSARHPQSLLCYEMYDRPLDRGHGAPLRLSLPTKLGYKHAKYLMTLEVTHVLPARRSFWSAQGYSWYAGL
jgi:DMSO/TMAO reductase YedYZ molybdopterin-dependent catalytic subunit